MGGGVLLQVAIGVSTDDSLAAPMRAEDEGELADLGVGERLFAEKENSTLVVDAFFWTLGVGPDGESGVAMGT